jgi:hypothetical protein
MQGLESQQSVAAEPQTPAPVYMRYVLANRDDGFGLS